MTQVVLLGYGGPERLEDVRPFLDRIIAGRPIPPARYEQVLRNYEAIGGRSPFNELTRAQAAALQDELRQRGIDLAVRTAYRFAPPLIADVARESDANGEDTIAVIMAAQQSAASWDSYVSLFPNARFTQPFYERPGFIRAHADRVRDALTSLGRSDFTQTALIFTAHSIPVEMARAGPYVQQLQRSSELVAQAAGAVQWRLAYTSRTGNPAEPWLEPDVRELLRSPESLGAAEVVIDPIGFVCDHVEVLYDLDVDAAAVAAQGGIRMARAAALNDHPAFIGGLAAAVQACIA